MPGAATHSRQVLPGHRTRAAISITTTSEHATVAVSGEVDLALTPRLQDRLDEELRLRPAALIIDFTGVTFCSSGGLSVLLDVVADARVRGIPCAIIATERAVLRPVRLLGLGHVLPIHPDRTDAETWLSLHQRLR